MAERTHPTARIVGAPDAAYEPPRDDDPVPLTALRTHLARCAGCRDAGAVCVVGAALARVATLATTRGAA